MALYAVARIDKVQPGEFAHAYVLAGGAALARKRVEHFAGVSKGATNVKATKIDVGKVDSLLNVYFDEREKGDFA